MFDMAPGVELVEECAEEDLLGVVDSMDGRLCDLRLAPGWSASPKERKKGREGHQWS